MSKSIYDVRVGGAQGVRFHEDGAAFNMPLPAIGEPSYSTPVEMTNGLGGYAIRVVAASDFVATSKKEAATFTILAGNDASKDGDDASWKALQTVSVAAVATGATGQTMFKAGDNILNFNPDANDNYGFYRLKIALASDTDITGILGAVDVWHEMP